MTGSVEPQGRGRWSGEDGSYTSPRSNLAPSPRPWCSTRVVRVPQRTGDFPQVAWKPRALLLGSVGALGISNSRIRGDRRERRRFGVASSSFVAPRARRPLARLHRGDAACVPDSMLSSLAPWRATPSPLPSPSGIHEASRGVGIRSWDFLRSLRTPRATSLRPCSSPRPSRSRRTRWARGSNYCSKLAICPSRSFGPSVKPSSKTCCGGTPGSPRSNPPAWSPRSCERVARECGRPSTLASKPPCGMQNSCGRSRAARSTFPGEPERLDRKTASSSNQAAPDCRGKASHWTLAALGRVSHSTRRRNSSASMDSWVPVVAHCCTAAPAACWPSARGAWVSEREKRTKHQRSKRSTFSINTSASHPMPIEHM